MRHGGGHNHRFGLTDGVLIKDNHLAAVGGTDRLARAVFLARQGAPHTLRIEIEVTTLDELAQALEAGADIVLLDNMDIANLRKAVVMTDGRALLEVSGGVTLESVTEITATGVDLISVGALTHSAPALDISPDLELSETHQNEPPHSPDSQWPVPQRHGNMADWLQIQSFNGVPLYVLSQRIAVSARVR